MKTNTYHTTSSVSCVDPQLLVIDILMPKGLLKSGLKKLTPPVDSKQSFGNLTNLVGSLAFNNPERGTARNRVYVEGGYASLPFQ